MLVGFIACSIACTIGFIVGRCFRDLEGLATSQDLRSMEIENDSLRYVIETMQADLEAILEKSREEYYDVNEE